MSEEEDLSAGAGLLTACSAVHQGKVAALAVAVAVGSGSGSGSGKERKAIKKTTSKRIKINKNRGGKVKGREQSNTKQC
jgi:hypothetical protein